MIRFSGKQRVLLIVVGLVVLVGASLPMFMSASCFSRSQTPSEIKAINNLRAMTRGGVLPSESVVAQIESDFPRTKAAALARIVRARIKLAASDFAGAASLLDTDLIKQHTSIGDYGLFMRANALEQAGKPAEARIVYEQLVRDFPSSAQARVASLRAADIMLKSGNGAAVPLALKGLITVDEPTALFLAARAAEQTGDTTRAIGFYRRLYFYAPAATESADAALALTRLGASTVPANAEEGAARANKLFVAKKFADAYQAYADTVSRFPSAGDAQFHLNRGTAALSARKLPEAIAALNSIPTSAGEVRAEALSQLAQAYARNRQWDLAKSTLEELRRQFPSSVHAPKGFAAAGRIADEAKNAADASFLLRSALSSFKGSGDLAQAQFDIAWDAHEAKNYRESSQLLT